MIPLQQFSDLLEALYSATLDREQWQRFLTLLCDHTESTNGYFFCADSCMGLTLRAIGGTPRDAQVYIEYNSKYGNSDPFRTALIRKGKIDVFDGEELLPDEGLLRNPMYSGMLETLNHRYATLIPLSLSLRRFEALSLWRSPEQGPIDKEIRHSLSLLIPHIQNALAIQRTLRTAQQRAAGAKAIADATSTAAFLVTTEGRPVHSNAAGQSLLSKQEYITLLNGRLATVAPEMASSFFGLLQSAAKPFAFGSKKTGNHVMLLFPKSASSPMQLLISPLSELQIGETGAELLILITDPDRVPSFADEELRALYSLTPAETEVANGLLMGYSLNEIACLRHVSEGTVRNQLKTIMSKTATSRQSELVRLLMTLPQPFSN